MWVSIFIARDEAQCDEIMNKLHSAGIMNRVRPGADKKKGRQIEVQVMEQDAADAQDALFI